MKRVTPAFAKRYASQLEKVFLFRGLAPEEIEALLVRKGVGQARYAQGEVILSRDMGEARLGILLAGRAAVTKETGGGALHMGELIPPALFGMAALFAGEQNNTYPTCVRAKEPCVAFCIEEATLRALMREDGRLMDNYLHYLTGRIHFLNARIEGLTHPAAKSRVLLYLMQNAVDGGVTQSLTTLARALNISRATLYRTLDALEQEGAIRREGKHIELLGSGE